MQESVQGGRFAEHSRDGVCKETVPWATVDAYL